MSTVLNVSNSVGPQAMALARAIGRADGSVSVLIAGEDGAGQNALAALLTQAFICLTPKDGEACGECRACSAFSRGVLSDAFVVEPDGPQDLIRLRAIVFDKDNQQPFVREFLQVGPIQARSKVVIIRRAERLNRDAADALLKLLEEPPDYARFILTTTSASSLLPTIRSRCMLLPCDFGEPSSGLASLLSGGAPELAADLSQPEMAEWLESMEIWLRDLPSRRRTQALKVSEEFQELAALYKSAIGNEDKEAERLVRAEFVRLFANWLASSGLSGEQNWALCLESTIEMHRAVLGNVNFGYLADSLFMSCL